MFLNFTTRVLNFYNFHDEDDNFILARHLFGNTYDFTTLVTPCHENNQVKYWALQEEWSKSKSARSEKQFLDLYKDWYYKKSKCQLWHMLQEYKHQEVMFESILVPFNVRNVHWVNVQVLMPSKKLTNGMVSFIDHLDKQNSLQLHTLQPTVWLAKYMGVYHKEHKK